MSDEQSTEVTSAADGEMTEARDSEPVALTVLQEQALQQLAAGTSIKETARVVGVGRRTVHRWLKEDANFAAAYNAWRRETVDSGRARVLAMTDLALDTVQNAMLQGNARIAVQVAKATGALDAPRPGPSDAGELRRRRELKEGKRELRLEAEEKQYRKESGRDDEANYDNVLWLEHYISTMIALRECAVAKEAPEVRAARVARLKVENPHYVSREEKTARLLQLIDEGFDPFAVPLRADKASPAPQPAEATLISAGPKQLPPAEPAALTSAPAVAKTLATRAFGSTAPARKQRPYDANAADPLDAEHWVDL